MKLNTLAIALSALLLIGSPGAAFAIGAIAVDDEAGSKPSDAGYGIGFGDSQESAQAAALKKCQSMGNDSCKVVVWFKKCGAYVSSAEKYGIGYGESESVAQSMAMNQCGGDSCKVVASECDD